MHFDNLIFLLLIAIAALFKFLVSKAGNAEKSVPPEESTFPSTENTPVPRPTADTDEERIRRFLEALGQPTSSNPPAPAPPRTHIPPRPLAPVQPPRTMFSTPTVSRRRIVPTVATKEKTGARPLRRDEPTRKLPAQSVVEPIFEVQERASVVEPQSIVPPLIGQVVAAQQGIAAPDDKIDITALLNSPSGLRNAIILREIFGPPRSLQDIDFLAAS